MWGRPARSADRPPVSRAYSVPALELGPRVTLLPPRSIALTPSPTTFASYRRTQAFYTTARPHALCIRLQPVTTRSPRTVLAFVATLSLADEKKTAEELRQHSSAHYKQRKPPLYEKHYGFERRAPRTPQVPCRPPCQERAQEAARRPDARGLPCTPCSDYWSSLGQVLGEGEHFGLLLVDDDRALVEDEDAAARMKRRPRDPYRSS